MCRSRDALVKRYPSQQRILFLSEIAFTIAFLATIAWTGAWLHLRQAIALTYPASITLLFTILFAAHGLLSFPLSYYRGQILPERLGLSRRDGASWLGAKAREALLEWLVGTIAAVTVYLLLSIAPAWWWLAAAIITALVSALLTFLVPAALLSAFFKMAPLPAGELQQRLAVLATKAGFQPAGMYSMDWSRRGSGNAMLLGMGRSRRVVLADTMIRDYPPDEIEAILAHELGHWRKRHVLKLFLFQSGLILMVMLLTHIVLNLVVATGGPFGHGNPADPVTLPLVVLLMLVFGLVLSPALLAFNRRFEAQSDVFGLELTGDPASFVQALSRLHRQNLVETDPGRVAEWLFSDHPPLMKRMAIAREFERSHQTEKRSANS